MFSNAYRWGRFCDFDPNTGVEVFSERTDTETHSREHSKSVCEHPFSSREQTGNGEQSALCLHDDLLGHLCFPNTLRPDAVGCSLLLDGYSLEPQCCWPPSTCSRPLLTVFAPGQISFRSPQKQKQNSAQSPETPVQSHSPAQAHALPRNCTCSCHFQNLTRRSGLIFCYQVLLIRCAIYIRPRVDLGVPPISAAPMARNTG